MSQSATQTVFPIGDFFNRGWEVFRNNAGAFVIATVAILGVSIAATAAAGLVGMVLQSILGAFVGNLLGQVVSMAAVAATSGPLAVGYYGMARNALGGRSVAWTDIFAGYDQFVPAATAGFLISLFSTIGILLCVIPGLIVAVIYLPTFAVLADRRGDGWSAMERSRQLVMANPVQWTLIAVLATLLAVGGLLLCFVGLLVTMPVVVLLIAQAYDLETAGPSIPTLPAE